MLAAKGFTDSMYNKYGKVWGIYTQNQAHAKALANAFDCNKKPEVHGDGDYGHYHDGEHLFHIWYGGKISY